MATRIHAYICVAPDVTTSGAAKPHGMSQAPTNLRTSLPQFDLDVRHYWQTLSVVPAMNE